MSHLAWQQHYASTLRQSQSEKPSFRREDTSSSVSMNVDNTDTNTTGTKPPPALETPLPPPKAPLVHVGYEITLDNAKELEVRQKKRWSVYDNSEFHLFYFSSMLHSPTSASSCYASYESRSAPLSYIVLIRPSTKSSTLVCTYGCVNGQVLQDKILINRSNHPLIISLTSRSSRSRYYRRTFHRQSSDDRCRRSSNRRQSLLCNFGSL